MARRRFEADPRALDTYYVAAHFHWFAAVGALFLVFAGVYFALEQQPRGPRGRLLGGLHVAATFLGANLIFLPQHLLGMARGLLPGLDGVEAFFLFNGVASAGYLLALVGQVFFVAVLIDAFRRGPDPG